MILNNSRDVEYDPANSHRRCRLEWPRDSDTFFQYLKHYTDHSVSSSVREEATGFVQAAFNKCGGDAEQRQDDLDICGAFAYAKHKNKPLDQSAIWDVFCALTDSNLLTSDVLSEPVDLTRLTPAVISVSSLLSCFMLPVLERRSDVPPEGKCKLWGFCYSAPIQWLATMIIRGSNDVNAIFEVIRASVFLGPLDLEEFETYKRNCKNKHFEVNPKERVPPPTWKGGPAGPYGFWLPHNIQGINEGQIAARAYTWSVNHFNIIEQTCKRFFNATDEQLLLEEDQEKYYNNHPERLPGFRANVAWM